MADESARLNAARELIKSKDYEGARAILKTIPANDKAKEWLAKIDEIVPEKGATKITKAVKTVSPVQTSIIPTAPVVCPKCYKQHQQSLNSESGQYDFICPDCKAEFSSTLVTVRAKHSHYAHNQRWREFSARVILPGNVEREITFVNYLSSADLELRSRDKALFTLFEHEWAVVQNLTINKYLILGSAKSVRKGITCVGWFVLAIILFTVVGVMLFLSSAYH